MSILGRFREEVRKAVGGRPLAGTATAAGLPRDAIRSVLAGHDPRLSRAIELAEALDLDFYIGPPLSAATDLPGSTSVPLEISNALGIASDCTVGDAIRAIRHHRVLGKAIDGLKAKWEADIRALESRLDEDAERLRWDLLADAYGHAYRDPLIPVAYTVEVSVDSESGQIMARSAGDFGFSFRQSVIPEMGAP